MTSLSELPAGLLLLARDTDGNFVTTHKTCGTLSCHVPPWYREEGFLRLTPEQVAMPLCPSFRQSSRVFIDLFRLRLQEPANLALLLADLAPQPDAAQLLSLVMDWCTREITSMNHRRHYSATQMWLPRIPPLEQLFDAVWQEWPRPIKPEEDSTASEYYPLVNQGVYRLLAPGDYHQCTEPEAYAALKFRLFGIPVDPESLPRP